MKNKLWKLLAALVTLAMLAASLAGCATPTPEVIEKVVKETVIIEGTPQVVEKVVTQVVEKTVEVEKIVEVTVEAPPAGPEGTLVRAVSTFPNSLDLPQAAERQASTTSWQMYDSLVWFDDEGKIVPALAESWDGSEDNTE